MPLHIDELYAFIALDTDGEGVAAYHDRQFGWVPMVGADRARIDSLRPIAQGIAAESGKRLTLVRFTTRTELDVIEPPQQGGQ